MKSIIFALALTFTTTALAGADCQYRIGGTDTVTVTPTGITGKMSCSKKQTEEIVAAVVAYMKAESTTDAVVVLGDLNNYWSVRSDLAKALSENKEWDSAKGANAEGAKGVVTGELITVFEPLFLKHSLRVSSANLEQMGVEDASKQAFKNVKGKYPFVGKITLTVTKTTH